MRKSNICCQSISCENVKKKGLAKAMGERAVSGQQHDGEAGGLFEGHDLWGLVVEAQGAAKDETCGT